VQFKYQLYIVSKEPKIYIVYYLHTHITIEPTKRYIVSKEPEIYIVYYLHTHITIEPTKRYSLLYP
jgi:hypothetical protein